MCKVNSYGHMIVIIVSLLVCMFTAHHPSHHMPVFQHHRFSSITGLSLTHVSFLPFFCDKTTSINRVIYMYIQQDKYLSHCYLHPIANIKGSHKLPVLVGCDIVTKIHNWTWIYSHFAQFSSKTERAAVASQVQYTYETVTILLSLCVFVYS